jgi:hypothetical protein
MTVTMKLSEWKALKEQLPQKWPAWELSSCISKMVIEAAKHFNYTTPSPETESAT